MNRQYLGDGLYVEYDGYQWALITSGGMGDTNTVYLEWSVLETFFKVIESRTGVKIKVEYPE